MQGSLALVGSGEYLPAMLELERLLIQDGECNGKEPTFVQIPTAAGRESRDRILFWESLGKAQAERLGVSARFLPIFDRDHANNPDFAAQIVDSALVYMSGGDPHYLANTLRGTKVFDAIVANWNSGGSLAGCSAGAMVMSPTIPNFRLSRSEPTTGLHLIPDIRVIPHFNKFFKWIPESAAKILLDAPGDSILLGIDELTALVQRSGDDDWQVFGEERVHILKGLPTEQLAHGARISLNVKNI
jgi:cyanophycinase-like exopeptidase